MQISWLWAHSAQLRTHNVCTWADSATLCAHSTRLWAHKAWLLLSSVATGSVVDSVMAHPMLSRSSYRKGRSADARSAGVWDGGPPCIIDGAVRPLLRWRRA
jgi:hypothetical protein